MGQPDIDIATLFQHGATPAIIVVPSPEPVQGEGVLTLYDPCLYILVRDVARDVIAKNVMEGPPSVTPNAPPVPPNDQNPPEGKLPPWPTSDRFTNLN